MKLGIFAKTFEGETPDRVLRAARDAGFAGVQYNMACSGLGALPSKVPEEAVDALAIAAEETGVEIAAISATYDMTHPDKEKREAGRRSFEALASVAPRVRSRIVTVCTGSLDAQDQWRRHPDNNSAEAWDEMVAEFRHLVPIAERQGVLIGIEPELADIVSTPTRARRLLDMFPTGPLRIVLDPANLFEHASGADVQMIVREAVDLLGPDIALAHAKDRHADGRFAAAGKGVVNFGQFVSALRRVGFDGALVTHGLAASEAPEVTRFLRKSLASSQAN